MSELSNGICISASYDVSFDERDGEETLKTYTVRVSGAFCGNDIFAYTKDLMPIASAAFKDCPISNMSEKDIKEFARKFLKIELNKRKS